MSDSGRQIGDCEHGETRRLCRICLESALVEANAVLESVCLAQAGEPVSDFMESFPPVREALDARARLTTLKATLVTRTQERDEALSALRDAESKALWDADYAKGDAERIAALTADLAQAREALKAIAARGICADDPSACTLESGPYCGTHTFDEDLVEEARAALSPSQEPR